MEGMVTIGVEFNTYLIKVEDKVIRLQIWDTAGQESFRSVTKIFYRGAHAVVLNYPIDSKSSFDNVHHWLNEV
jgi:GTPase SAR1 family protein